VRAILSIVLLILFLFRYKTFWRKCERIGIGKFSISFWAIVSGGLLALAFLEALHYDADGERIFSGRRDLKIAGIVNGEKIAVVLEYKTGWKPQPPADHRATRVFPG
jgi:hypothetical protein